MKVLFVLCVMMLQHQESHPDVAIVRTMIEYGTDINVIEEVSKVTVNYCLYAQHTRRMGRPLSIMLLIVSTHQDTLK